MGDGNQTWILWRSTEPPLQMPKAFSSVTLVFKNFKIGSILDFKFYILEAEPALITKLQALLGFD